MKQRQELDAKALAAASQGGPPASSGNGGYKSQFLKDKIIQQNEKKKIEKKMPRKVAPTTEESKAPGKENATKAVGGRNARKPAANEEELLEVIEDLKFDLKARDQEFEQMRLRVERLEA